MTIAAPSARASFLKTIGALCLVLGFGASPPAAGAEEKSAYLQAGEAYMAKDYAEARRQWERSLAEGGPNEALNNLGYLLYYGLGGPADRARAVGLWRQGAALAVSESQVHLGHAYEEGGGVVKDRSQAYAWYQCGATSASRRRGDHKAERQVEQMANEALARLSPRLTRAERAEGERLARELIAKYSVRADRRQP